MSIKGSPSKLNDDLKEMQRGLLLNELAEFARVTVKKSITLDQIAKVRSTIRELKSSLEKQIESDSQNETGVKINEERIATWYYNPPRLVQSQRVYDTEWYE